MEFIKQPWTIEAGENLTIALGGDAAEIEREVNQGISELWRIPGCGFIVTRCEQIPGKPGELVLVAGQGARSLEVIRELQRYAASKDLRIRIHSTRPGMKKHLAKIGFYQKEIVFAWQPGSNETLTP